MKPGTIICACSDTTSECIALVRAWCKDHGYTADTVRVIKRDGQVLAELKCDMDGDVKDTAYDRS